MSRLSGSNNISNSVVVADRGSKTSDFDKIMERRGVRYGMPYADFDDQIAYFDVARLPDYNGMPMPLVGHILFTRPSLNVDTGMGNHVGIQMDTGGIAKENYGVMQNLPMTAAFVNDTYGKKLLNMLTDYSNTPYMPIFTTRAKSYSVGDIGIETVDKATTFYGHVLKYGECSSKHKVGGTISIDFRNDSYQSILKACYIWLCYIWYVSCSDAIEPAKMCQFNGILDYAGSIYYLVTDMTMSRLVYWEKLTGVFPKTVPMSIFSYNDAPFVSDDLSIEFDYGVRSDPCDVDVLFDINVLSSNTAIGSDGTAYSADGVSNSRRAFPNSLEAPFGLGNSFATRPIIKAVIEKGVQTYYLQWIKR